MRTKLSTCILSRCIASLAAAVLLSLCHAGSVGAQPVPPPVFGEQTDSNRFLPRLVPVYHQDFESGAPDIFFFGAARVMPAGSASTIAGERSVRIAGSGGFVIGPSVMRLEAEKTYVIEYRYKVLDPGSERYILTVAAQWSGLQFADGVIGGTLAGQYPLEGVERNAIRIATASEAMFVFLATSADVVVDSITVYRQDSMAAVGQPSLLKSGFPRLGKYSLLSPFVTALNTGASLVDIEDTLSLFDLVTGVDIDHTWGPTGWHDRLRAKNPDLLLLPYFQAFVAQHPEEPPLGGSAKLRALFNRGLHDAWFMLGPDGARLDEPRYPQNFQMNHTDQGPQVDGMRFGDYARQYLTRSVLPSGRWNGIHFDQVEWYPNPLLGDGDPFLGGANHLPPIDLDLDGLADSSDALHAAWRKSFEDYFRALRRQVGDTQLLLGNAGYVPANPTVLSYLNGWQREFTVPYPRGEDGDWKIDALGDWYRLVNNLAMANRHGRAPQVVTVQFTGFGLGIPTGRLTANGLADRLPILEARDFRRMRFGLVTTLLSNSFYGYDYVDNTTAPVWFDEYAVDADGRAVRAATGKGYLGQPLGAPTEVADGRVEVFNLDFERIPPAYVDFGSNFRLSTNPGEVIDGTQSVVFELSDRSLDWNMLTTRPGQLPLDVGQTYHLELDYKLLGHRPLTHVGLFVAGITDTGSRADDFARFAAVIYPDIDAVGQRGRVRTAVKVDGPGFFVRIGFSDRATIAVDNIRLTRGAGGVFRRDFERGIVLVNPSPEAVHVPQSAIAGTLARTGIRRILGQQDPGWNDGSVVSQGITLPSGDAIILVADTIPAPAAGGPADLRGSALGNGVTLNWTASTGNVAGYLIRYAENGVDPVHAATAGETPVATIEGLEPGRDYRFHVTPFDFRGRLGAVGATTVVRTAGVANTGRPTLDFAAGRPTLVPGSVVFISGTRLATASIQAGAAPYPLILAGTRVTVNGIAAALLSVSPEAIGFIVPWEVGGADALLRVEHDGGASPAVLLPLRDAQPQIWSWDGRQGIVLGLSDGLPIGATRPAVGGERLRLLATGLGLIAPAPDNGVMPAGNYYLANPAAVQLAGSEIEVLGLSGLAGLFGTYAVDFQAPAAVAPGEVELRLRVGGTVSNPVVLPFR